MDVIVKIKDNDFLNFTTQNQQLLQLLKDNNISPINVNYTKENGFKVELDPSDFFVIFDNKIGQIEDNIISFSVQNINYFCSLPQIQKNICETKIQKILLT